MAGWENPTIQECLDAHWEAIDLQTTSLEELASNLEWLEDQIRWVVESIEIDSYQELWFESTETLVDAITNALTGYWWMSDATSINEVIAGQSNLEFRDFMDQVVSTGFRGVYLEMINTQPIKSLSESYQIIRAEAWRRQWIIDDTHNNLPQCLEDSTSN